ncbi:MAG: hypothetical protein HC866_16955 [Leptolyngbyaceae cyanobacterium RU_5_1]|nr:hypothetical protein [Leptolyngbyaceae cyanobacterium RU_5_1]
MQFFKQLSNANLTIAVTESADGVYEIIGKTDMPEGSEVAVAAVRYLNPGDRSAQDPDPKLTYSILDYKLLQVEKGKWQTTLKLWQAAADGRFQEVWQQDQTQLGLSLKPEKEVVFLATLAPPGQVDQLQNLEQQLAKHKLKLDNGLIRTTANGQQYVQVGQTRKIPLPTGNTTPPTLGSEEINGGWGNRFLLPLEPQNPYKLKRPETRKTNAPAKPEDFLQ